MVTPLDIVILRKGVGGRTIFEVRGGDTIFVPLSSRLEKPCRGPRGSELLVLGLTYGFPRASPSLLLVCISV